MLRPLGQGRVLWQVGDGQCSSAMLVNTSSGKRLWQRMPIGLEARQDWTDALVRRLAYLCGSHPALQACLPFTHAPTTAQSVCARRTDLHTACPLSPHTRTHAHTDPARHAPLHAQDGTDADGSPHLLWRTSLRVAAAA
eukprot:364600-Chlamydomonas_euryale.AAC.4